MPGDSTPPPSSSRRSASLRAGSSSGSPQPPWTSPRNLVPPGALHQIGRASGVSSSGSAPWADALRIDPTFTFTVSVRVPRRTLNVTTSPGFDCAKVSPRNRPPSPFTANIRSPGLNEVDAGEFLTTLATVGGLGEPERYEPERYNPTHGRSSRISR